MESKHRELGNFIYTVAVGKRIEMHLHLKVGERAKSVQYVQIIHAIGDEQHRKEFKTSHTPTDLPIDLSHDIHIKFGLN